MNLDETRDDCLIRGVDHLGAAWCGAARLHGLDASSVENDVDVVSEARRLPVPQVAGAYDRHTIGVDAGGVRCPREPRLDHANRAISEVYEGEMLVGLIQDVARVSRPCW